MRYTLSLPGRSGSRDDAFASDEDDGVLLAQEEPSPDQEPVGRRTGLLVRFGTGVATMLVR